MKDLLSAFSSSFGASVYPWLWASAVFTGLSWIGFLPLVADVTPFDDIMKLATGERISVYLGATLAVGLVLATASIPLTRVLEGYYIWPPRLREFLVARSRDRFHQLRDAASKADEPAILGRVAEKLNRLPREEEMLLPTRLGNALRAGETYGWVKYRLSIPDLWVHLASVSPEGVTEAIEESGSRIDFFVATFWLSMMTTAFGFAATLGTHDYRYMTWVVASLAVAVSAYRGALISASWYSRSLWALVDLSREPLAEALGLRLPSSLDGERKVWLAVTNLAVWGTEFDASDDWTASVDNASVERGRGQPKN